MGGLFGPLHDTAFIRRRPVFDRKGETVNPKERYARDLDPGGVPRVYGEIDCSSVITLGVGT